MSLQPVIRPAARQDLVAAVDYLTDHASDHVAHHFIVAVGQTLAQLIEHPALGVSQEWRSPNLRDCRRWPVVKPFQDYLIFYSATEQLLDVVRVLHGARDIDAIFQDEE